ncbi:MAG: cysteine--tRNA ligase [candidate division Zixibacteria bacterium]|nr:cysteine--tRNA ligase [candidate division Zixibacteria bacterium]
MALKFFNTMTRSKEAFAPIEDNHVRMYTCGPTVYNFAHIGNLRTFLFEDILNRYLTYKGFKVTQVMNLTDIDDKTIKGCIAEQVSLSDYTQKYKDGFFEDIDTLKIKRASVYPSATEHVDEMVEIIQGLLEKGAAYKTKDGSIYYKISSFDGYGKLSHMKMDELRVGASERTASDEYEKEQVSDFALWKSWDEVDGDVFWETPIGKGRPGWHIECSAMSMKYLGETFDIHTGGVDNIFPHHENEIAQSEGYTGNTFANMWMHAAHLIVEGKKMSKSAGNFYTLREILEKGYAPLAIRFLLISTHYRMPLNFTFDGLDGAKEGVKRYNDFIDNLADVSSEIDGGEAGGIIEKAKVNFVEALDDDLNMSEAFGVVFNFIRDINRLKAKDKLSKSEATAVLETIAGFDSVFDLRKKEDASLDSDIEAMIQARIDARDSKNWAEADRIRDELQAQGIILEDTPGGTKWKREL